MPTGAEHRAARRRDGRDLPGLQRGVRRHGGHVVDAHRPLPAGELRLARMLAASLPVTPRCTGCRRCSRRGVPAARAHVAHGRGRPAGGAGPCPLGPPADPPGLAASRAGRYGAAGRRLHRAGRDRRLSRPCPAGGGHRLGPHRRAVRPARLRRQPGGRVNRAVAHGRAFGPAAGLACWTRSPTTPARRTAKWHAVRGDLLSRASRVRRRPPSSTAASLTRNDAERSLLSRRAEFG